MTKKPVCHTCKSSELNYTNRIHKDSSKAIEVRCSVCNSFIKWAPLSISQTEFVRTLPNNVKLF